MRKLFLLMLLSFLLGPFSVRAQGLQIPGKAVIREAPEWARKMYASDPDVYEVDRLYTAYYRTHTFEKNYHTQYYKRWRRAVDAYVAADGHVRPPSRAERAAFAQRRIAEHGTNKAGGTWSVMGPLRTLTSAGDAKASQTNVYSIDRSLSNTSVMYCGTETGMVFRSNDGGSTWSDVSSGLINYSGVTAVKIHPTDPDIVLAGAGNDLFRTTDGGGTWTSVQYLWNLRPNEIFIHPANPQLVIFTGQGGLYRSTDGGVTFSQLYTDKCWDIKAHPTDPAKLYLLKSNSTLVRSEFFISTDTGSTFTLYDTGWYSSTDPDRDDQGGRIGVTPANPNRVYAYLIGAAKANDIGFIGLYRSDDAGQTWSLPNGPPGGPYTTAHPNLARGTTTWNYHQGYYNCALMVSATNADSLLIGGLNLWRSNDGAYNFQTVAGYMGGPLSMHVDNQDFRVLGNEYWITTDGGIYRSMDFFTTQPEVRMNGVHGSDYWGFGSGWNEDVLVGGLYHNGNLAWHENYPAGDFLSLGGGEAPTGYVNPGENRKTYFSDVAGKLLPLTLPGTVTNLPFAMAPTESYWAAYSSELEFHPHCYNIAWLGKDNVLYRTNDGGATFNDVYTFGGDPAALLHHIEISSSNPDVMYVVQRPASGNVSTLRRTDDGGQSWSLVPLPGSGTNMNRVLLALDPENEDQLWIAYPQGSNGNKIYRTTNGGSSWTNITSNTLDGHNIHSMTYIGGTNGMIYVGTNSTVFYKDNSLGAFQVYDSGLPLSISTDILRPFYRDSKIRIASYGKGIWQAPMAFGQDRPVARPTVDKLSAICAIDTFYFEDYSMLNHTNASWDWTFQGGTPATSTDRNPKVVFSGTGQHLVTLTVTDGGGNSDTDSMYIELTGIVTTTLAEGFENNYPPDYWSNSSTGNLSWTLSTQAGGYGTSSNSAFCDSYNVNGQGTSADLRAPVNLSNVSAGMMYFDVAYSYYGGQYTDTLEVLASTDCGQTWTSHYKKGGDDLATAPSITGWMFVPNDQQWRTDSVDLSAYSTEGECIVAFRIHGYWGQALYLDNINLDGTPIVGRDEPSRDFATLTPNPVTPEGELVLRCSDPEPQLLRVFDLNGRRLLETRLRDGQSFRPADAGMVPGTYVYWLEGPHFMRSGKILVVPGR